MKKLIAYKFLILFYFMVIQISAQVNMEINNNLVVETSGNISIELSGDLIENGTGYLKGNVTSGERGNSGISSFAGLELTNGVNKITRTTGTALSSSSPKTTLRSYEILNSSSAIVANVTSDFIPNGINDESNSIADKYIFTKIAATWKGYSDNGSLASSIKAANVNIPSGTSDIAISEGIGVGATILLEGPYTSGIAMSNTLTLPAISPYSEAPRTATVPANAVDWILVELRSGTDTNTSLGYRSAFVDINGKILSDDGSVGIGFPAIPSNYRLVLKHRNHLSVMSSITNAYTWISL